MLLRTDYIRMHALISGITGTALLVDGESISSLQVDDPSALIDSTPGEVRQFLARAHDAYAIEDAELQQIQRHLDAAWEATAIFNLTQILLSPTEQSSTRTLAAKELHDSLEDDLAAELAERRLFSAELPEECGKPDQCTDRVEIFLDRLFSVQPAVKHVSAAFYGLKDSCFEIDDRNVRDRFLATSIREGVFRLMVLSTAYMEDKDCVYVAVERSPSLRSIRDCSRMIRGWMAAIEVEQERTDPTWTLLTDAYERVAAAYRQAVVANSGLAEESRQLNAEIKQARAEINALKRELKQRKQLYERRIQRLMARNLAKRRSAARKVEKR